MGRRLAIMLLFHAMAWMCASMPAFASKYYGQVTFGGFGVPGATIALTQGEKKLTTTSDEGGSYRFDDLPDGQWKIEISLQCFATISAEVTVAADSPPGRWELQLLPLDELKALAKTQQPDIAPKPSLQIDAAKTAAPPAAAAAPTDIPKPPDDASQESSDGFLVNGSVNNAATSPFSLDRAFGNKRANSKSLYNGGIAFAFDNSVFDAKQYSISGIDSPKPAYNRMTGGLTFGGPLKIPHLLLHGPNLFLAYQWTRNHTAETVSGLVPTEEERSGNLLNAAGQPTTIIDPVTGLPYPGSVVPVSSQARRCWRCIHYRM